MFKKVMTALLCLCTILSLAACGDTNTAVETTAQAVASETIASGEETQDPTKDANGYELDDLPSDLDYKGETVKILCWEAERKEFEIKEEEISGALVEQAIYDRNLKTEERLKVVFEWEEIPGNNSNRASFVSYVEKQQAAGNYYDIIASYARTIGMLSTRGFLKNLNTVEDNYINFEKPWWPERLVDTCTIGDALYYCSGDVSTNILHFMYVIWYNMEMREDLQLEDPVKLVDNHEWTFDKMVEMSKGIYSDLDNDGKQSVDDRYAFTSIYYGLDAFYTGSGLRLIEQDADSLLKISDDYTSQKCIDLMDKLGTYCVSEDCYISGGVNGSVSNIVPFTQGNALFCQNRVYIADNQSSSKLNQVEWEYGILPTPLYDKDQENYITVIGNPFTLWSVMDGLTEANTSRATAVIESLCSYGYRLTTPALFETNMKYRYTSGAENDGVRMFDIIHNTIDFDLGRIYSDSLNYMSEIPSKVAAVGGSWGAACKNSATQLKKLLKTQVVNKLEALD